MFSFLVSLSDLIAYLLTNIEHFTLAGTMKSEV